MRTAAITLALFGALAASAAAQTPTPTPPPEPAATKLTLTLENTIRAKGRAYALGGERIRAVGRMEPASKGERVEVRFARDGKLRRTKRVKVRGDGTFRAVWRTGRGNVRVVAVHPRSEAFAKARSAGARVKVLRASLGGGTNGPLVRLYQRGLAKLGYAVARSGRWDDSTARASMAYRKVNGIPRRFAASRAIVRRVLAGKGAFKPRYDRSGRWVEADLSRQVLALIEDGKVFRTYHTSTGAPATPTVLGTYSVYRKDPGTNAKGMVHSSHFIRGYAIHGYASVPPYNASHGCLRVPVPNAWFIYSWVRMGDKVSVYR
jgi:hypothetical protein